MQNFRTDLAEEAVGLHQSAQEDGILQTEYYAGNHIRIVRVDITSQQASQKVGKPCGSYTTVFLPPFGDQSLQNQEDVSVIAGELSSLLPEGLILVVGLGNRDITPDAFGPRAAGQIIATRHLSGELKRSAGLEAFRPTAVLAPGVLGQTGVETVELIQSVVSSIRPAGVLVLDALASRSLDRLGCTIQLADNGISPGSGVQNARRELSAHTLGVPVISLGVPTVVDASTLAADLLEDPSSLEDHRQVFQPRGASMIVTPREIDLLIQRASSTAALAVNKALHPRISVEDFQFLLH